MTMTAKIVMGMAVTNTVADQTNIQKTLPDICWLVLTQSCNNRCVWCYAKIDEAPLQSQMPRKLVEDIIKLASDIGIKKCVLLGGEPTIYPHIEFVIKKCTEHGIKTEIVTNGRRLSDKEFLKRLKDAGVTNITISLEGHTSELHDKTTRIKGSFSQLIQGIKNCMKLGINFSTITTISSENKGYLKEIINLAKSEGLKKININLCGPTISNPNSEFVVKPRELALRIEELYAYSKEVGIKTRFTTPLAKCFFDQNVLKEAVENGSLPKGKACQVFDGKGVVFDLNGGILPCTHWMGLYLGNLIKPDGSMISSEEFEIFWTEGPPELLRRKMAKFTSSKCTSCELWGDKCVGGCPLFWLKFDAEEEIRGLENGTNFNRNFS